MAPITITLKALDLKVPKNMSVGKCREKLNAFKAYAFELYKFFTDDVDEDDERFEHLSEVIDVDITKDIEYTLKDENVVSYDEFSMGVSIAAKFKAAFNAFHDAVERLASCDDDAKAVKYQALLDDHMIDFYGDLDSHVCAKLDYCCNELARVLENWGGDEVDDL